MKQVITAAIFPETPSGLTVSGIRNWRENLKPEDMCYLIEKEDGTTVLIPVGEWNSVQRNKQNKGE